MKKLITVTLLLLFAMPLCKVDISAKEISTSAGAAILYCADNDEVIYSHNMNKKMKMASTTKIMTALITLERAKKKNKTVKFTRDMIEEGSSMYLKIGEKVTLKDLCVGMLLPSGNDAATAAAISIAGSKGKFADLMNIRADNIGMKNTNFVTPSGLDDDEHYSTAYDMALLMKECISNKDFLEISGSTSRTVSFINPSDKVVTYNNHNRLLSEYVGCIAGKTGYTMSAGRCLVTVAKRDGVTLIAVTLDDKNDWEDHKALYDYGFSKVHIKKIKGKCYKQNVVGGVRDTVTVNIPEKSISTTNRNAKVSTKVILPPFQYAPIKKGSIAGIVYYYVDGKQIDKELIKYDKYIDYKHINFISQFLKGIF